MILSVLFVLLGTLVYLMASGGPVRVRIVTVPVQVTYLLVISWVAWNLDVRRAIEERFLRPLLSSDR